MHSRPVRGTPRSVFLSDTHLGAPHCRAGALRDFLSTLWPERLYLVGDIVDLHWIQRRRARFSRVEAEVLDRIVALVRAGTEVTLIPGNHDAELRRMVGDRLAGVRVRRRALARLADGRQLLVTHGDEFDAAVRRHDLRERFGEACYDLLLDLDRWLSLGVGPRPFSLAGYIKARNGQARAYVARFEQAAVADVRRRGLDGIVCGHIHVPALKVVDGVLYANDGDWVENQTALVEDGSGALELLRWNAGARVETRLDAALPGLPCAA